PVPQIHHYSVGLNRSTQGHLSSLQLWAFNILSSKGTTRRCDITSQLAHDTPVTPPMIKSI
ncbi:MAG: hypothetical protein QXP68_06400, partial [Thermosphaera sp.]